MKTENLDSLFQSPVRAQIIKALDDWMKSGGEESLWFRKRSSLLYPGYVYLIEAVGSGGVYKVGCSVEPDKRLCALATKAPYELKLIEAYPVDAMRWAEGQSHKALLKAGTTGDDAHRFYWWGSEYDEYDGLPYGEYMATRTNGEWFQGWLFKYPPLANKNNPGYPVDNSVIPDIALAQKDSVAVWDIMDNLNGGYPYAWNLKDRITDSILESVDPGSKVRSALEVNKGCVWDWAIAVETISQSVAA